MVNLSIRSNGLRGERITCGYLHIHHFSVAVILLYSEHSASGGRCMGGCEFSRYLPSTISAPRCGMPGGGDIS